MISTMNRTSKSGCDRDLPSEHDEPPINPLLIHIVAPFVEENNPSFISQGNGEELWKWREVTFPKTAFDLIQNGIRHLGYQFEALSQDRVGRAWQKKLENSKEKWRALQRGKKEKNASRQTCEKLSIKPDEVKQTPKDVKCKSSQDDWREGRPFILEDEGRAYPQG